MATGARSVVTVDTNIAVYALTAGDKATRAEVVLQQANFASVQIGYEFANVVRRKFNRPSHEIVQDLQLLQSVIPLWHSVSLVAVEHAVQLAGRYQLQFYDSLLIAVALANGATTLWSEDMQHGLVIDERLTIRNPFRENAAQ